jgi:hypothetical protein
MVTNIDRAQWAGNALSEFANEVMGGHVDEEAAQDLITDIGHFARHGLGMGRDEVIALFQTAIGAWSAEDRIPLEEPQSNDIVRIKIQKAVS